MSTHRPDGRKQAAEIAVAILTWLASEPDLLGRFLALSGLRADQLRSVAGDPGFVAALIDFLTAHEPTLEAFCQSSGIAPEQVAAAALSLSDRYLDSGEC